MRKNAFERAMLEAAPDSIIALDRHRRLLEFNPAAERTFGYRRLEVLGREMATVLISPAMREDFRARLVTDLMADRLGPADRFATIAARSDGTEFPAEFSLVRVVSAAGLTFVAYLRDTTEQDRVISRLKFEASHDGLTALLNRSSFLDRLDETARRTAGRDGALMAVLFLDVDRFKLVNDRLGHLAGDQLLVAIARELQACVRPADTVARLGGDEFAILLENINDVHDATAAADRIQASLHRPLELDGHCVVSSASIGITLSRPGEDKPEELLRAADAAMYRSKAQGPASYEIVDRRDAPAPGPAAPNEWRARWSAGEPA